MSYNISTLAPSAYSKKSNKSNGFNDADNFIKVLHKQLEEWNLTYCLETKAGIAYKLKFNNFEKYILSKSDIILYIVSTSSVECFQSSMNKLLSTCQTKDSLNRIISISLDGLHVTDLNGGTIEFINFSKHLFESEEQIKWKELRDTIENKLQNIGDRTKTSALHKSSSRLKTLFHISSTKSDLIGKKTEKYIISPDTHKDHLPRIKVSESFDEKSKSISGLNDMKLRNKDDHTKLSSTSIFKKISRRTRDSGLSMTSTTSTQSGSKNSDTLCCDERKSLDVGFDASSEPSTTSEKSAEIYASSLGTRKIHDSSKANKALGGMICFHSPQNSRRKKVKNALFSVAQFSSFLIRGSSDICLDNLKSGTKTKLILPEANQRCHSEPPVKSVESAPRSQVEDTVQCFMWTPHMIRSQATPSFEVAKNEIEIEVIFLKPTEHYNLKQIKIEENYNILYHTMLQNEFIEAELSSTNNCNIDNHTEDGDPVNFDFDNNQSTLSSELEAHKNLTQDFEDENQRMCGVRGVKSIDLHLETSKKQNINSSPYKNEIDELFSEEKFVLKSHLSMDFRDPAESSWEPYFDIDAKHSTHQNIEGKGYEDKKLASQSDVTFKKKEQRSQIPVNTFGDSIGSHQSYIYQAGQTIVNNPIVVGCILTAAAISAPIWSSYIPHNVNLSQMFYGAVESILKNEMVQSIPNQLVSAVRESTIVTASSLQGFLISGPNNNVLFHSN